jgi:hypothetical protein
VLHVLLHIFLDLLLLILKKSPEMVLRLLDLLSLDVDML